MLKGPDMKFLFIQCIFGLVISLPFLYAREKQNKIIVNADLGQETISRYIYGHFAEHLGHCIYGGFWVEEDSPIPNTRGIRNDVVQALKEIKIPVLRWPGGCFADIYHWRDGVGPRNQRPPILNYHWGGVTEDNSFGTYEFMDLCEQLGCEPYIAGNVGSGSVEEMKQWVEYMTSDKPGPMSNLRRKNGRNAPWKMHFLGIGNEAWGCGGNMNADYYADLYNHFATFCRDLGDNKLYRIACGPYGEDTKWTETLMKNIKHNLLQGLSIHFYTVAGNDWGHKGSATQFNEDDWFETLKYTLKIKDVISKNAKVMDQYDPEKKVGMIVDEWGDWWQVEPGTEPGFLYQQNTLRDALVAAINLNIFNNHCDRVKMANIAQTVNVLQAMVLTKGEKLVLTPSYYVFKMYTVHHDATMLPLHLESATYDFDNTAMPAISASASKDQEGRIHLSLTNADPKQAQEIDCNFRGVKVSKATGTIITADAMNAFNDFDKEEQVKIADFNATKISGGKLWVKMPPKSVVTLEIY